MYEKLNLLAKSIISKFAPQTEKDEEFAVGTINRLSQIAVRNGRLPGNSYNQADTIPDGYLTARLKRLEMPEDEQDRPITHWCTDTSKYQRQAIRQGEQLRGVEKSFEIDPMANLADLPHGSDAVIPIQELDFS